MKPWYLQFIQDLCSMCCIPSKGYMENIERKPNFLQLKTLGGGEWNMQEWSELNNTLLKYILNVILNFFILAVILQENANEYLADLHKMGISRLANKRSTILSEAAPCLFMGCVWYGSSFPFKRMEVNCNIRHRSWTDLVLFQGKKADLFPLYWTSLLRSK